MFHVRSFCFYLHVTQHLILYLQIHYSVNVPFSFIKEKKMLEQFELKEQQNLFSLINKSTNK